MAHFRKLIPSIRTLAALAGAAVLGACSQPDFGPSFPEDAKALDAATFECCFEPEKFYPAPVARLAMTLGNDLGPTVSALAYSDYEEEAYPGRLTGKPEALDAILSHLRPLDIVNVGNTSYKVGRLMPGRFSHTLVYLGTEAQLRAAGLWHLPEIAPHRADIRAGKTMIESVWPEVMLSAPGKVFETDRVLVMRPRLAQGERRLAAARLFSEIGKPFNYALGLDPTRERWVCTGLVEYAMPGIALNRREVYGADTILPDDVAAQAIRGERLDVVAYVLGNRGPGFAYRSSYALMVDIAAYWGIPGTPSAPRSMR
ncbi:hypothetical protein [Maritimibacter sp. HL-12]|uniref:hypothetical protein n=1 Tax=Maritimibacter sp. HL-12 TaxID=1162418 RepID=UPI000A0F2C4C|nr:hypothetical protein [Maritimibacter sp. HL-12]SMH48976.1 hypothetical protein SAMN05661107_2094 [Maritimibacter sp. HL-12]